MGGLESSPKRKKKDAAKRRAEEAAWRAKSGPVTTYIDPEIAKKRGESRPG
jgi:hypothetical protein